MHHHQVDLCPFKVTHLELSAGVLWDQLDGPRSQHSSPDPAHRARMFHIVYLSLTSAYDE